MLPDGATSSFVYISDAGAASNVVLSTSAASGVLTDAESGTVDISASTIRVFAT